MKHDEALIEQKAVLETCDRANDRLMKRADAAMYENKKEMKTRD